MALTELVRLSTPLKVGDREYEELVLTEPTTADILDAQEDAERVVMTADGPAVVASPSLVGLHLLRRQVSVGDLKGVDLPILRRLSAVDFRRVQEAADALDTQAALRAAEALASLDQRGRPGGQDG